MVARDEHGYPETALDCLGNHATTCKWGGDATTHHNHLRSVFFYFCHCAHLGVRVNSGSGLTPDLIHTQPADVPVLNWERGKHAAFDITVNVRAELGLYPTCGGDLWELGKRGPNYFLLPGFSHGHHHFFSQM